MRGLWRELRDALLLDIGGLEYLQHDPAIRELMDRAVPGGVIGVLRGFVLFGWVMTRELVRSFRSNTARKPDHPIVFFSLALNHHECLAPVAQYLPEAWMTCANVNGRSVLNKDGRFQAEFPLGLAHLVAIPFFPVLLYRWATARGWRRLTITRFVNVCWMAYGYALVAPRWLRRTGATSLVIANDHVTHARLLQRAAKRVGIPTYYVQHACITPGYPPLDMDYALLDGEDASRKYAGSGPATATVYLVGISKLDGRTPVPDGPLRRVGICTNVHDSLERTEELLAAIREGMPELEIVFRPRPSGSFTPWEALARKYQVALSWYDRETATAFLGRLQAVVAGNSSILLEAALLNVSPLYFDFTRNKLDWHGFVANGLCDYTANPREVTTMLAAWATHRPNARQRARAYSDTLGTSYDGCSGELAASVIRQTLVSATPGPQWTHAPFDVGGADVYRLAERASA